MKIELLYFDGCPSWENGLKNLETALQEADLTASVEMVKVTDDEGATQLKFLGSPSFRIDGHDLWPEERENYSLSCRIYPTPEGIKGCPTTAMLKQQLKQFKGA
jgi:hypothetical protein